MYPVFLNSRNEDQSFETFYRRFIGICNEHKERKKALVFAFILYDFGNPQISKVLKDPDYWRGLHKISGEYLTVFSLHFKKYKVKRGSRYDNGDPELDRLATHLDPAESSNLLIEKYFGKRMDVKYPAVIFFQVDSEKVTDYVLIELDEEEIEQAFLELKGYVSGAVKALKSITVENRSNLQEIFDNVERSVQGIRTRKLIVRNVKKVTSIAELGATIAGLGS